MQFDFFWTDICFLMLLMVSLCLVVYGLRKQPIRASLSIILHKPVAVSAGIVLFLFLMLIISFVLYIGFFFNVVDIAVLFKRKCV